MDNQTEKVPHNEKQAAQNDTLLTNRAQGGVALAWFVLTGATVGLLVGALEAAFLSFSPRPATLLEPDVHYVIWFVAPLAGLVLFGLVGSALGLVAARQRRSRHIWSTVLIATLAGCAAAYLASAVYLHPVRQGDLISLRNLAIPLVGFVIGFGCALLLARIIRSRVSSVAAFETARPLRYWALALLLTGITCVVGVAVGPADPRSLSQLAQTSVPLRVHSPNLVLITLDTVRADHVSAYGYHRPTTPNLDRWAARGVLFENAIAPSPWTLTTHASIFTGLLPHQHGANWLVPLDTSVRTLAEILHLNGYETAGFTSNLYYGQAGWGMQQGFEVYRDDSGSRQHNLAMTMASRGLLQPLYQHLVRYDLLDRRKAEEVNRDVRRWFYRRSNRPFFLFINYFDAHDPYLTGTAYDTRFGRISRSAIWQVNSIDGVRARGPLPPADQEALIAGYDNCLAYLDQQLDQLLRLLASSPAWEDTIVIITSDHGEAFGEHGRYGHGWTVGREVLRVPLVFVGRGVPAGLRISHLARLRELFPTILELALGERVPLQHVSLRRFWTPGFQADPHHAFVISETMDNSPRVEPATRMCISLMTPQWHYLQDRHGRVELYRWPSDPEEKTNLADSPEYDATAEQLREFLRATVQHSIRPWRGAVYLFALDRPGYSFLREVAFTPLLRPPTSFRDFRLGASQAYFPADAPSSRRPVPSDEDLMKSLPYR